MKNSRNNLRLHRKRRIRAKVSGTAERPRLSVFRSLTMMRAQVIDDITRTTLVESDSKKLKAGNDIKGAEAVGKDVAKKCLVKKITEVTFDRGG